ncbi:peptidoglycan-binding protein [Geomicrobium sp. JCM 19039]|uniref:peptidoglycan-binding domain-containing protein n=1 Tax=Geomicrobium sp. JCM 19039 TaxID=1460636 RepID=UPI00045F3314|nr:peptidoglycan-binding protein [Geomicrobium sp. JCM 19039]GAK13078.1 cell wall lytic activity [Geomicrobium sp. JCM 19039]
MAVSTMGKFFVTSATVTVAVLTVPMIADAALENQVLRFGQQSEDVKHLQTLLKEKGYFTYQTATGYYGDVTVRAVRQFQGDHNLVVDGIAGPNTIGALLKDQPRQQVQAVSTNSSRSSGMLRSGSKGESVSQLQRQLRDLGHFSSTVDGHFGRVTEAAVRDFQRSHGLVPTASSDRKPTASFKSYKPLTTRTVIQTVGSPKPGLPHHLRGFYHQVIVATAYPFFSNN